MIQKFAVLVLVGTCASAAADSLTSRASLASGGVQVSGSSSAPAMDHAGSTVAFVSSSPNLVPGDTNGKTDVFVHDRFWGVTTRVSIDSAGAQGNNNSHSPAISTDGRYVAFVSFATNLVAGDTNNHADVFLHDRVTHITTRVSVASDGTQANNESRNPSIGGGLICFDSFASNLIVGDTNQMPDVFTKNLDTGQTELVSLAWNGAQGNGMSQSSQISASGTVVAFQSNANNLVIDDTNMAEDVFVRSLVSGDTYMVSLATNFMPGNGNSTSPSLSETGRFVAFESAATNLVQGDTNAQADIFVRDMLCMFTQRASVSTTGAQADQFSSSSAISADGRFVSFFTFATNLVPETLAFNENVVMRDTWASTTSLVSKNTPGLAANFINRAPAMSGNGRFSAFESFSTNLVPLDTNNSLDIFIVDSQATGAGPSQFQLVRGTLTAGGLPSLQSSDDDRLVIRPGITFSSQQAPIEIYFVGQAGMNVAELEVFIEASSSSANISQTVEIFNFISCLFESLGTHALTPTDTIQSAQPNGELSPYIGSGGDVWMKVTYHRTGPVFAYPWSARIDQVRFVASQ